MKNGTSIRLSLLKKTAEPLAEIEMPIDFSETASLKYTEERMRESWGKISLRRWIMPGFCFISEFFETHNVSLGTELVISGAHVSIVCNGGSKKGDLKISPLPFDYRPGTVEVRNSIATSISIAGTGYGYRRIVIVLSKPFLAKMLEKENWIKNGNLYDFLGTDTEDVYQYYLELPIQHILNSLLNETFKPSQKRYYFELKLKELLFLLQSRPGISGSQSQIPADIQQKLITAKAYLHANYHTAPTIKQLSRIVSLNEFKLKHFFKKLFGTTIKSYVIALRMEEAKNLLYNRHSVNDVAIQLGYRNVSHFILVFKRTFGETPLQMARQQ